MYAHEHWGDSPLRVNEVNVFANGFEIICGKNCFEISCGEKIYLHSTLLITDSKHQNRMLWQAYVYRQMDDLHFGKFVWLFFWAGRNIPLCFYEEII